MAAFYGWTDEYISGLDVQVFQAYWLAITAIEYQRLLPQLTVSAFPHVAKKSQREKIKKDIIKGAKDVLEETTEVKSYQEVVANLTRKLNSGQRK